MRFIMSMHPSACADPRRCLIAALLCFVLLGFAVPPAQAKFSEEGKEDEVRSMKLSPELEKTLTALLDALPENRPLPAKADLERLVGFMISPNIPPAEVRPAMRAEGEGVFARQSLRLTFPRLVRYCFDPSIPTEVLYPTVLRRGYWLPEGRAALLEAKLWEKLNAQEPVVLRGTEYEEITPDSFSGCYYHYRLNRLIVLMRVGDKPVILSVSRQPEQSSVGFKGAVVGRDSDWNYVYTKVVGSTLKLVGWADTYMYGSANVSVMYENGDESGLAFFKWVKAGWSNINMVKTKHITAGGRRFLAGMRQVLESPSLPKPEEIRACYNRLEAMNDAQLREALTPYAASLAGKANDGVLSGGDFQAVLQDGRYPAQLGREDLISELMKLYMKERLGMRTLAQTP